MWRIPYGPITALLLLLDSSAMAANGPPEPPEPPAQKELREQANRLVKEGRLVDARDIHLSLWRINPRPGRAFNVGMLSHRIGDYPTAAEYLTRWFDLVGPLDAPKTPIRPGDLREHKHQYEQAQVDLEQARKHVGAIEVRASAPGAEVLVDDRRIGVSPLKFPVFVSPGRHRIVAQLGDARVEETVAVEAGGERTLRLVFAAAPTAAPAPAPPPSPPRAAETRGPVHPWILGVGASAAGTLLVAGLGFRLAANGADDDVDVETDKLEKICACNAEYKPPYEAVVEHQKHADLLYNLGSAALITGAAVGAATLIYVVLPHNTKVGVQAGGAQIRFAW